MISNRQTVSKHYETTPPVLIYRPLAARLLIISEFQNWNRLVHF